MGFDFFPALAQKSHRIDDPQILRLKSPALQPVIFKSQLVDEGVDHRKRLQQPLKITVHAERVLLAAVVL